jgi:hypothetical protein
MHGFRVTLHLVDMLGESAKKEICEQIAAIAGDPRSKGAIAVSHAIANAPHARALVRDRE